ncbi:MAG TPA: hypothetical protein VG735_13705 [Caulobacterales bacterium]|nr:hypothetical protein [Caulobacterales bacterium]
MWFPRPSATAPQTPGTKADLEPALHSDQNAVDTPRVAPAAGEPAGALLRTLTYFVSGALGGLCSVALTLLLLRLLGGEGYKSVGLALSASMFVIAVTFAISAGLLAQQTL